MSSKVLVCGQRDFVNKIYLFRVLDDLHQMHDIYRIVHGAARGADSLAGAWASERGIMCASYPANWSKYGKAAGPIRNQEMLDMENPDFVVAFFNDLVNSKGTKDMVKRSLKAYKRVHMYEDDHRFYAIASRPDVVEKYRNVYNDEIRQYWSNFDAQQA